MLMPFHWCFDDFIILQIKCTAGDVSEIVLREFPPSIEHLSLAENNIPVIKTEAFVDLKHLRKLILDGNNISRIVPFAFKGLGKLRELIIHNNHLTKLEKFSFSGLQNLTAVLLNNNRITTIEESTFAGTSNVRFIYLNDNPIHTIQARAFANLRNVEHLIFPSGIRVIEADAFDGLDSVGLLRLPSMDLSSLEPYTFRGLTHVHVLAIQESDLGVVKPNVFVGLVNVGSLNLIKNKIDHLQELRITPANRVKVLRLLGNHVLQAPPFGAVQVEVLENFTVVMNHFPCDCRIHTVLESPLANGTSYNFTLINYCISPLELNGKVIQDMGMDRINRCAREYSLKSWDAAVSVRFAHLPLLVMYLSSLAVFVCSWSFFRMTSAKLNSLWYFFKLLRNEEAKRGDEHRRGQLRGSRERSLSYLEWVR